MTPRPPDHLDDESYDEIIEREFGDGSRAPGEDPPVARWIWLAMLGVVVLLVLMTRRT